MEAFQEKGARDRSVTALDIYVLYAQDDVHKCARYPAACIHMHIPMDEMRRSPVRL